MRACTIYAKPKDSQLGKNNLPEDERVLIVDWVKAIAWNSFCAELLPDCVRGQPVHVHLHIGPHLLVGQELPGNDLDSALGGYHAVHWGLSERVKFLVLPPHEIRLEEVATVAIVLKLSLFNRKKTILYSTFLAVD